MGFETLCGNAALKQHLQAALSNGKTAHSYLIVGPEGSGRRTLARLFCAALECTAPAANAPCLVCPQCRKVLGGIHPDVVWLGESDKKTITVSEARQVKSDLYIRPNEGKKKIYVFPPTHLLGREAQNALLKVVEEPPEYGLFLFLTEQAEQLLPTIRSRSAELTLSPVPQEEAAAWLQKKYPKQTPEELTEAYRAGHGFLGAAARLLRGDSDEYALAIADAFAAHDCSRSTVTLFQMEKLKREQLQHSLEVLRAMFAEALSAKYTGASTEIGKKLSSARTAAELMNACRLAEKAIAAAEQNGGVGHICGFLAAELQ